MRWVRLGWVRLGWLGWLGWLSWVLLGSRPGSASPPPVFQSFDDDIVAGRLLSATGDAGDDEPGQRVLRQRRLLDGLRPHESERHLVARLSGTALTIFLLYFYSFSFFSVFIFFFITVSHFFLRTRRLVCRPPRPPPSIDFLFFLMALV